MPRQRWEHLGPGMTPERLELVLRNYSEFRELYRRTGLEELDLGDVTINVHDVLKGIDLLPKRQREALVLTCLYGMREVDAARLMGLHKRSSPVGAYKKLGLRKLVALYWQNGAAER